MNRLIMWLLRTEMGRRVELQVLADLVSTTPGLPGLRLLGTPSAQALDCFAAYTAEHLGQCSQEQQRELYARAFRLGRRLRSCFNRRDHDALTMLVFQMYRNIGIDMEGHFPGDVLVPRCHFSGYYSPQICRIASLMDAGVICGLFGGGRLEFTERITEGAPCCLCRLGDPPSSSNQTDNSQS